MATKEQTIPFDTAEAFRKRWYSFRVMWHQTDQRWKRLVKYRKVTGELREKLSVDTLRGMLDRLLLFAESHYQFFLRGFLVDTPINFAQSGKASIADRKLLDLRLKDLKSNYTIGEYILGEIFDRMVFDLQAIDQAIDQRMMAVTTYDWDEAKWKKQGVDYKLSISNTISLADELAIGALLLLKEGFVLDRFATAITYQRTSSVIRVMPYADVALIGLPISVLSNPEDLLAIPHEIGHYLYWNGKKSTNNGLITFQELLEKELLPEQLAEPWLEEIVADIVSTLIGGPVTTYSLMQKMQTAVGEAFTTENGEHPIPAIRPLISFLVLEKNAVGRQANSAGVFRGKWDEILQARGVKLSEITYERIVANKPQKKIAEDELEKDGELGKLVATLIELISINQDQLALQWYWPSRNNSEVDFSQLASAFIEDVVATGAELRQSIRQAFGESKLHSNPDLKISDEDKPNFWINQMKSLFGHSAPTWLNPEQVQQIQQQASPQSRSLELVSISADEWLTLFDAGGWTSGGDGPSNVKGG